MDKRNYTDSLAHKAQNAAKRVNSRTVQMIIKALTGAFVNNTTVLETKLKGGVNIIQSCQRDSALDYSQMKAMLSL